MPSSSVLPRRPEDWCPSLGDADLVPWRDARPCWSLYVTHTAELDQLTRRTPPKRPSSLVELSLRVMKQSARLLLPTTPSKKSTFPSSQKLGGFFAPTTTCHTHKNKDSPFLQARTRGRRSSSPTRSSIASGTPGEDKGGLALIDYRGPAATFFAEFRHSPMERLLPKLFVQNGFKIENYHALYQVRTYTTIRNRAPRAGDHTDKPVFGPRGKQQNEAWRSPSREILLAGIGARQ